MLFFGLLISATLLSVFIARMGLLQAAAWPDHMRHGLAIGLLVVGLDHLVTPERYLAMIEGFLPAPQFIVALTGLCEIAGAIGLLFPATRRIAGLALAAYFVAVFPANIANAIGGLNVAGLPQSPWYFWVRLAFQPLFVWWALVAGGIVGRPVTRYFVR
ncbi:MAG: hypothetical protein JJU15_01850 [Pararhodobacter sp.]|nr:hypothetical protein [Pararhodobacter sp.]